MSRSRSRERSRRRRRSYSEEEREWRRRDSDRSRPHRRRRDDDEETVSQQRLVEREAKYFNIWQTFPSPSPERKPLVKESKKTKSKYDHSSEDDEDKDERERRRKKQKEQKRAAKTRRKRRREEKQKREEEEEEKRRRRRRLRKKKMNKVEEKQPDSSDHDSSSSRSDSEEDVQDTVEEGNTKNDYQDEHELLEVAKFKQAIQGDRSEKVEDDDGAEDIGPQPLLQNEENAENGMDYGKALLPGEGAAIAQYVQKNMRIPRRGEVGWNGGEIQNLETLGYVMSGSRHQRMNAIRIRKENQVYSAEEKRALALINFEEKQQKENKIMGEFRNMLTNRLTKKHGANLVEDMATENANATNAPPPSIEQK